MTQDHAYHLFEKMISRAQDVLFHVTLHQTLDTVHKADKSLVTACDQAIDTELSKIAQHAGLEVISEEGKHAQKIVLSGNYITIDPIDGTLGYIDYVKYALEHEGIHTFLKKDLGPEHDFNVLLGIVENGFPQYGACYNFVTHEKILIDGNDKNNFIRENNLRDYSGKNAVYRDQRPGGALEEELTKLPGVSVINQATLGLKSLYVIINLHESAVTVHQMQNCGLWDIMPAAVAARVFGGEIYDNNGNEVQFKKYIVFPPTGAIVIKGEKFKFVLDRLQKPSRN